PIRLDALPVRILRLGRAPGRVIVGRNGAAGLGVHEHRLEAIEGLLSDWTIAGAHSAAAAFDVARTVCRRAERGIVRLAEAGEPVAPGILAYVNRLSDLLWLFGRKLELDAGVSGSLRAETGRAGNRWSRAW
ncbi:MAG: ATP:cob(I)alamin adenosyltransferase, partial [Acidobacteria bacterium]|nr:ATP:cob(I)alamin adenosyltransferase [Acidobacteriota bacterium]